MMEASSTTPSPDAGCSLPGAYSATEPGSLNSEPATWHDAALLAAIGAIMCLGLGRYGLYEPHEGHFAGVGREMIARGDWITPHLNGAPYLNKPPLLYWLVASCYTLFGVTEWAARLPLALAGWAGVLTAWDWARKLWGIRAGRAAALILSVSAGWYLFSHQLMIDLLLSAIHLVMAYTLWLAVMKPERFSRWALFYFITGLSVLAKGPVGLVFGGLMLLGFAAIRRDWKLLKTCRPFAGLAIVGAVVAPWLVQIELRNPGYLHYAIVNENVKRALDTRWPPDYSVVKVSAFMFLVITATWMAPWSFLLPQICSFTHKRSRLGKAQEAPRGVCDGVLVLALAAVIPVLLFIPIPSRLVYYSLPAVPPFAVLAAGWWSASCGDCYQGGRKAAAAALAVLGAAVFSAAFWVPDLLYKVPDLSVAPDTIKYVDEIAMIMGVALLAGAVLLVKRKPGWSIGALAVVMTVAFGYNVEGFAAFDAIRSSKKMVLGLRDKAGKDWVWISEGSKEIGASAGIAWYLGHDDLGRPHSVLIMEDDPHRLPPSFPGAKPVYLIDQARLAEIWNSSQPALFVTDFARSDWFNDPPRLPRGPRHFIETAGSGNRRVYANDAAWQQLKK